MFTTVNKIKKHLINQTVDGLPRNKICVDIIPPYKYVGNRCLTLNIVEAITFNEPKSNNLDSTQVTSHLGVLSRSYVAEITQNQEKHELLNLTILL